MGEAFRLGGWGMYPIAIAGLILVVASGLYARSPSARRKRVVSDLRTLTMLVAVLGCVTGVIKAFTSVGDAATGDVVRFAIIGLGESMMNVGFGLVLLVLSSIGVTIGGARTGSGSGSELVDPMP